MNGKLHKNIGFSLLPFAFIFLFEPGITVIDPLPDLIGYAILCIAVINLADINPRIAEALGGFRKGILISLLRFLSIYLLDKFFVADEQTVGVLLFTFVFGFFELVILIPSYRQLFEGLLSLGMLHNGTAVYLKRIRRIKRIDPESGKEVFYVKESRRNITEKAYTTTVCFFIVRTLATTLPEFTTLISNSSYEFVRLLRLFGFMITLPIGIFWLVKMVSYCAKIRRDTPFLRELSELYLKNARGNPNFYVVRRLSGVLYVMIVAFLISADFYSDYINLLPDFIFYVTLIISTLMAKKFSRKWILLLVASLCGAVLNLVTHFVTVDFHNRFYPGAIRKNIEAYNAFYRMAAFSAVDAVILVITVAIVIYVLWDIFKNHTDFSLATTDKERKEERGRFLKGAISTSILSFLAACGSVYYVLAQPFYNSELWFFYYSNIISVLITLTFTFSSVYFIGYVAGSIKYRYRLDI